MQTEIEYKSIVGFAHRAASTRRLLSGACLSVLAVAATTPSVAQEAPRKDATVIQEIVVTARKRTESLQDVPISISAVTANDIASKGAVRVADVFESMPNVSFEADGVGAADVNIRGVTSSTNNLGIESAVGLYVDEVYVSRPVAFNQSALDIERIEVLRGPQGTLFGRNTVGGVINITTTNPGPEFAAKADATYGRYDLMQFRATVSGPINDQVGALLSVGRIKRDGWFEQRTPGLPDYANEDAFAVRGKLQVRPTDAFDATLSLDYSNDKSVNGINEVIAGPLLAFDDGLNDSIATNEDNREKRKLHSASLRMNYDLGGHVVTSVTGFQKIRYDRFNDQDYTALDILATGSPEKDRFFSQELRVASAGEGPLSYVAGLYYSYSEVKGSTRAVLGGDVPAVVLGMPIAGYEESVLTEAEIDADAYAAFVSGAYDFNENWTLAGGVRVTHETKSLDYAQTVTPFLLGGAPIGLIYLFGADVAPVSQDYDDTAWSGDASLTYKFSSDASAYVRYSRGYKAGGFDSTLSASADPGDLAFDSEFVDLYEAGFKSEFWERRARFNAAAFHMEFSDKQEQIFNGVNFLTSNAASATIDGVEAELTLLPVTGLRLNASVGYADATYDDFVDILDGADYSGNRLPGSAKWSSSLAAEYSFSLTPDWRGIVRGEANYRSGAYTTSDNDPDFRQKSHVTVNTRVGVEREDGRYGLFVWGRNITDERYLTGGFNFLGNTFISRNMPSSWGVELRARY